MKETYSMNRILLFFLGVSILYSIFISFDENMDSILNGISFSSSIVTIVVTALNILTLWQLENYKKNMYKKADCKIAVRALCNIQKSIDNEIINTGKCRSSDRYLQEVLSHINSLLDGNKQLSNVCERHLSIIKDIKIIDDTNKETLFRSIEAIITLYEKGE